MDVKGVSGAEQVAKPRVGEAAPDFDLPMLLKGVKGRFRLSNWAPRQKSLALVFYPLNWEESTARQLVEYQAQREQYLTLNAELVTVSVDSIMNTTSWEREIGPFDFPMCSDFWPHGEVCQRYGVLRSSEPNRGAAESAVFVINHESTIRFQKHYGLGEEVRFDEVLDAIRKIESLKG